MADAILVKKISRSIDSEPTKDSLNLVTSGGVKSAIDTVVAGILGPEVHIGNNKPANGEAIWFDTTAISNTESPVVAENYVLLENVILYADYTNGNDITGNGSIEKPYKTISAALNALPKNLNGNNATVNIAAGTYYETLFVNGFSSGNIILNGNGAEIIVNNLEMINNTAVSIENLKINTSSIVLSNSVLNSNSDINVTGNGASTGITLLDASTFFTEEGVTVNVSSTNVAIKAVKLSKGYFDTLNGNKNIDGIVAESGANITVGTINLVADVLYTTATGASVFVDAQTTLGAY